MATPLDSRKIALVIGWVLTITVGIIIGRQTNGPASDSPAGAGSQHPWAKRSGAASSSDSASTDRKQGSRSQPDGAFADRDTPAIETLQDTLQINDELSRTRRMLDFVDTLSTDQFEEVVEAFRADGLAKIRGTEYKLLLNAWVKADPYAAAEYIGVNDWSGNTREGVIAAWATTDPQAAAAWIEGREDDGGTNNWVVGLMQGIASTDPTLALEAIEALGPNRTRSKSMEAIFPYVIQQGFEYSGQWVASIQDADLQRGTARQLGRQLTRIDPAQAGTWVADLDTVATRRDASEEVSDEWARQDLEGARLWAENLPEDTRTEAAEGVARHMAREDPQRTADWLNSLGTNPDLDGARQIFLSESARNAPEVAIENVSSLSNPSDQNKMYGHILKRWSSQDRDATQTWVYNNASTLPENLVKHYLKPPKN